MSKGHWLAHVADLENMGDGRLEHPLRLPIPLSMLPPPRKRNADELVASDWAEEAKRDLYDKEFDLDRRYKKRVKDPKWRAARSKREKGWWNDRVAESAQRLARIDELKATGRGAYRVKRQGKGKRKMPSRTYKARQKRHKRKMPSRTYKARRYSPHRKYAYLKRFELNPRAVALAAMDIIDGDMTATQSSQASHSLPWFDSDQTSYRMKRSRLE